MLAAATTCLLLWASALASSAGAVNITEFPLEPGSEPGFITTGSDGALWFTEWGANKIGRITTTGQVSEYNVGLTPNAGLLDIATGPEGDMWFTEREGHKVGRITPQGTITEFSAGLTGTPDIYGITAGPGGDIWFTEAFANRIGVINPATGQITEFSAPAGVFTQIVAGPDGNLWYTDSSGNLIDRITPTGTVTPFGPLPTTPCALGALTPCPYPDSIAVGSDGNLWFNEDRGDAIGKITPSGDIAEYSAGLSHGAAVKDLALGPDGNMWFTEETANQVGEITPTGIISEYGSGITSGAGPYGIAQGPDGNLWMTEHTGGRIARIIPNVPPVAVTAGAVATSSSTGTVTGTVRSRGADTQYHFEYGPTSAYGAATPPGENGSGDSTEPVSAPLSGLKAGTVYHYRLVASNEHGTAEGADQTFATSPGPPQVTVNPFEMYFSAVQFGRHLRLTLIVVIHVKRGERVSYTCKRCGGGSRKGIETARRSKLSFATRNLLVSSRSLLRITVAAKDGSALTRTYGFDIQRAKGVLRQQQCFVDHLRKRASCPK